MANRTYNQFQGTLQKGVVTLYAKLVIDGSENMTVVTSEVINASSSPVTINPSNGFVGETIVPVDLDPGGSHLYSYKLKLQDPYVRLLLASVTEVGSAVPTIGGTAVIVDNVKDNEDPYVTVVFGGGSHANVTALFALELANSTAL